MITGPDLVLAIRDMAATCDFDGLRPVPNVDRSLDEVVSKRLGQQNSNRHRYEGAPIPPRARVLVRRRDAVRIVTGGHLLEMVGQLLDGHLCSNSDLCDGTVPPARCGRLT